MALLRSSCRRSWRNVSYNYSLSVSIILTNDKPVATREPPEFALSDLIGASEFFLETMYIVIQNSALYINLRLVEK